LEPNVLSKPNTRLGGQDYVEYDFYASNSRLRNFGGIASLGLDICIVYPKVKPILTEILPFIKLIPVWGSTVASAITMLMAALGKFCKMPS
jgi:hypothetical protein